MKILKKIVSYILVAALASGLTFALCDRPVQPGQPSQPTEQTQPAQKPQQSKLDELEQLILDRFIGDADKTAMEDAAAEAMVNSLGDRWSYYIPADQFESHMPLHAAECCCGYRLQTGTHPAASDRNGGAGKRS